MAIETERKYLCYEGILHEIQPKLGKPKHVHSGYFTQDGIAIRVTLKNDEHDLPDPAYKVCFKTPAAFSREEFEYKIPRDDARRLLHLCPTTLFKYRYDYEGWEIDQIELNIGTAQNPAMTYLWVAEWESSPNKEYKFPFDLPNWIKKEVTGDPAFSMQALAWRYGRKPVPVVR